MKEKRGINQTRAARQAAYDGRFKNNRLGVRYDDTIPDPETPEAFTEMVENFVRIREMQKKYDPRRHEIALTLPGDQPVGIVFTGDWQYGSWGCDARLWKKDMDALRAYREDDPEGLYAVGMGDYISALGVLNIRGSQFRDLIPPSQQLATVRGFFRLTAGMWLTLLAGCHDSFEEKASDNDPLNDFIKLAKTRHGWHGVPLTVRLGEVSYMMRLRHRARGSSQLNPGNAQRRQAESEGAADVIAHAHLHTSFVNDGDAVGQRTVMLRSGSYQIHDDYARQYVGNVKADPQQPMVILFPNRRKVVPFRDFRDGLDYLRILRGSKGAAA